MVTTYVIIYLLNIDICTAQQTITTPVINGTAAGLPYLLVILVFALIFGIPIILWFYRNYFVNCLKYINVKVNAYSAKAYERVSIRVSDASRKISERIRV